MKHHLLSRQGLVSLLVLSLALGITAPWVPGHPLLIMIWNVAFVAVAGGAILRMWHRQ